MTLLGVIITAIAAAIIIFNLPSIKHWRETRRLNRMHGMMLDSLVEAGVLDDERE